MVLMALIVLMMLVGWRWLVGCTCCCTVPPPYFYVLYSTVFYCTTLYSPHSVLIHYLWSTGGFTKPPTPYLSTLTTFPLQKYFRTVLYYGTTLVTLKLYPNSFSPISRYSYEIYF